MLNFMWPNHRYASYSDTGVDFLPLHYCMWLSGDMQHRAVRSKAAKCRAFPEAPREG